MRKTGGSFKLTIGKLRDAWRDYPAARFALSAMPRGKPIFITGTHRSGTTWFAKMLADPGLWYVHEPFNPNKGHWKESFTYAGPSKREESVDTYMANILNAGYRDTAHYPGTDHWLMPLRVMRPVVRRIMIKDPLACLLTGYLTRYFELETRVLFRHPAGFTSSILRLGWPIGKFLQQFLQCDALMSEHLDPYRSLLKAHKHNDNAASAAVFQGALNTVQWNQILQNPAIGYYVFEDLCREPIKEFERIYHDLGLPYSEETRQRHVALCTKGSQDPGDYKTHAVARNSYAMAESWKYQLTTEQVVDIRRVWEQFDIPLYSKDCDWDQTSTQNDRNVSSP